ncbi:MAG: DUF488 domain-containing protein [Gammaproteobacteria bacterium]|nr:DUF488 domain-containing protein [Gammaproteobacteria bacterium]MDD9874422.1 DUF488 domain-containing protein [Gammaproteobacteria bacterium]
MNDELFTIGHSTHPIGHFVELLKQHGVDAVCDVRSHPHSAYNPQFNRDALQKSLREHAIHYVFLGKELGARSENPDCYVDGKVEYQLLAGAPLFARGMERLRRGMEKYAVALMCAEKDPVTCHRMILVCRNMRPFTARIKHILADGALETNAQAERRLQHKLGIYSDLLRNEQQSIEDAYDAQGRAMAYAPKAPADAGGKGR